MIYLLEVEGFDKVAGTTRILRFASAAYVTGPNDDPANTPFEERIADPGNYERHLFGQGRTRGESDVAAGEITLLNTDGVLDDMLDLAFDGRALRLYGVASAEAAWSTRETILIGTMQQVEFPSRKVTIRLRDRLALIDERLQGSTYLGTTTSGTATVAEGNADLKDTLKPELFGRGFSIQPILVDQFSRTYQVSARALSAITAVRDVGVALTPTQDYPTFAALKAATIAGGRYATCLASGLIRVETRPQLLTVDATEGATLADRSAARIVQRMLAGRAGVSLDAGDVAALHAANGAECGIWISPSETTILAAAGLVLGSIGASLSVDRFGVFRMRRLELPAGLGEVVVDESNILSGGEAISRLATADEGDGVPARSVTVRYALANTVFSEKDLTGVNSGDAFLSFGVQEWRQVKVASAANEIAHPKGPELVFDTCLVDEADARAEANRLLAIYGARRDLFRVVVDAEEAAGLDLGDVVTFAPRRFGMAGGRPMRVLGLTPRFAAKKIDLEMWG